MDPKDRINDKIKANKGFDPLDPINDWGTVVLLRKTIAIFICLLLFYGFKQHKSMKRYPNKLNNAKILLFLLPREKKRKHI